MTLLIALEFNHTMQYVITRERGIIQGKIVILIAQLALARKVSVTHARRPHGRQGRAATPASLRRAAILGLVCLRCNTTGVATAILPHARARRLRPASCKCCWWNP